MGHILGVNAGAGDRHLAETPKAGQNEQHPYRTANHLTTAFLKIGPRQRTDDAFCHVWVTISRLPGYRRACVRRSGLEQVKGIEPSFSAWKADVLTVIRRLHESRHCSLRVDPYTGRRMGTLDLYP